MYDAYRSSIGETPLECLWHFGEMEYHSNRINPVDGRGHNLYWNEWQLRDWIIGHQLSRPSQNTGSMGFIVNCPLTDS